MGQLTSNPIKRVVNPDEWKEVFEHQTYIVNLTDSNLVCNKCGNRIMFHQRVTRLLTKDGPEYYHESQCLKGVEIISANIT